MLSPGPITTRAKGDVTLRSPIRIPEMLLNQHDRERRKNRTSSFTWRRQWIEDNNGRQASAGWATRLAIDRHKRGLRSAASCDAVERGEVWWIWAIRGKKSRWCKNQALKSSPRLGSFSGYEPWMNLFHPFWWNLFVNGVWRGSWAESEFAFVLTCETRMPGPPPMLLIKLPCD